MDGESPASPIVLSLPGPAPVNLSSLSLSPPLSAKEIHHDTVRSPVSWTRCSMTLQTAASPIPIRSPILTPLAALHPDLVTDTSSRARSSSIRDSDADSTISISSSSNRSDEEDSKRPMQAAEDLTTRWLRVRPVEYLNLRLAAYLTPCRRLTRQMRWSKKTKTSTVIVCNCV